MNQGDLFWFTFPGYQILMHVHQPGRCVELWRTPGRLDRQKVEQPIFSLRRDGRIHHISEDEAARLLALLALNPDMLNDEVPCELR